MSDRDGPSSAKFGIWQALEKNLQYLIENLEPSSASFIAQLTENKEILGLDEEKLDVLKDEQSTEGQKVIKLVDALKKCGPRNRDGFVVFMRILENTGKAFVRQRLEISAEPWFKGHPLDEMAVERSQTEINVGQRTLHKKRVRTAVQLQGYEEPSQDQASGPSLSEHHMTSFGGDTARLPHATAERSAADLSPSWFNDFTPQQSQTEITRTLDEHRAPAMARFTGEVPVARPMTTTSLRSRSSTGQRGVDAVTQQSMSVSTLCPTGRMEGFGEGVAHRLIVGPTDRDKVQSLERENRSLKDSISDKEKRIAYVENENEVCHIQIDQLTLENEQLNTKLKEQLKKNEESENDLQKWRTTAEERKKELDQKRNELQAKLDDLERQSNILHDSTCQAPEIDQNVKTALGQLVQQHTKDTEDIEHDLQGIHTETDNVVDSKVHETLEAFRMKLLRFLTKIQPKLAWLITHLYQAFSDADRFLRGMLATCQKLTKWNGFAQYIKEQIDRYRRGNIETVFLQVRSKIQ